MSYHPLTKTITDLLTKHDAWFETFEHQPVRTSEEAAKLRDGYSLQQGAKAIIARIKFSQADKKFIMLVLPGDRRFDKHKVLQYFSAKDIRFATEEEVAQITQGVQVGGVPPFGNLFNLEVVVDPSLFQNEKIIFNAGDRSFSIGMKSMDYQKIVSPTVHPIT